MPLTAAERQRHRREKLKAEGQHEQMKAADRNRKRTKLDSLTAAELEEHKRRQKANKTRYMKRMAEKDTNEDGPYQSNRSLGKAVNRVVSHLPQSPRKRSVVVQQLAKRFAADVERNDEAPKVNGKALLPTTIAAIDNFYNRDDISWQAPGKKDRSDSSQLP